jgi:6-phosphogluconolactonase (cycloisomerase 2 family)
MATLPRKFSALQRRCFGHSWRGWNSSTTILTIGTLLLLAPQVRAQTPQQQYVYGSTPTSANTSVVAGFKKDPQTGSLTSVSPLPFNEGREGGFLAIDGLGKFLFVLNPTSNNISMFQINQTDGALTEVQRSPFAAVPSSNQAPTFPNYLATEKSGQFLFVGYKFGNFLGQGAVNTFRIDANNLQLVQAVSTDIRSSPVGLLTDPKGLWLYVGLGPNPTTGIHDSGTLVFSINPLSGNLTFNGSAGGQGETGRCIGMDPQGRFFFDGRGSLSGLIDSGPISPVDGTSAPANTIALATGFPAGLLAESSGKFLYVSQQSGVFAYSIDQTTGALTLIPGGPLALNFATGTAVADPMGPYIYALTSSAVQGFQVDPATGSLTMIAPASTGGQGVLGVTISRQPVQAVGVPVAVFSPAAFDFGTATVGQPTITRTVHLANTGNLSLSVNNIAMTGTNPGDFTATPAASCQPPTVLPPNATCPISLVFTPAATGLRQASLTATDNAPGNPQSIPISGTGVPATPAVTLIPGNVSFPAITQGTAGAPQNITVTNSGTANLNIFSVVLGGANLNDFNMNNACASALAINVSCTISITFAPLGAGQRTATVTITDDAPGSPQTLALSGNATPAFTVTASATGSTSATVTAGQTAQFNLQLTPGTGFSGVVSLVCAGAPVAATCTAPSVLHVINGSPMPFSVAVKTSGSGVITPISTWPPAAPLASWRLLPLFVMCLLLLLAHAWRTLRGNFGPAFRWALGGLLTAVVLLAAYGSAGCGGGSSASSALVQTPTPTPTVTPAGTSTLSLTMTVSAAGGKQLAPPLPVSLTLTVK